MMPPGYWDKATILPAMQLVREKEREKQKRREELEAKKGIHLNLAFTGSIHPMHVFNK